VEKITTKILEKLSKIEKEKGELPLLLAFYRKLLQIQVRVQKRIGTPKPGINREAISQRMQNGQSLLNIEDIVLDQGLVQELFAEVIKVFASYPQLFGELPDKLLKPGARRLLTKKAIKAWFTGKELPATMQDGVSENIMPAIIQATLQPFLTYYSEEFKDSVDEINWQRGYCPICGDTPDFSYLDKQRIARHLICSRCDAEWLFKRLECPFCGCQEQSALHYFTDDKELYRLYTCQHCQKYIKTIDLNKTKENIIFPLERLLTIDMDRQARERGFKNI